MHRIAVFAALQWECRTVLRHLRQVRRVRLGTFTCWRGHAPRGQVWLVKTGMGVERAAAAVDALGPAHGCGLFVSTGCAGGLAPTLRPGDLVIASTISGDGTACTHVTAAAPRGAAVRAAQAVGLRSIEGSLLCSATVLATASEKRGAAAGGAVVVEMEGGAIAGRAAAAAIPLLSVRAILDPAEHEVRLPGGLIDPASGNLRPLALAGLVATHPGVMGNLMAMQRMQRAARDSLERFFGQWLAEDL